MKRFAYFAATLLVTFVLLIVTPTAFAEEAINVQNSFSQLCVNEDKYGQIIESKLRLGVCPVSGIIFNGNELVHETDSDKWYYSLVEGDKDAQNPIIACPEGYSIAFEKTDINWELLESAQEISFLLYNDSHYYESEIICTTLPLMSIETENGYIPFYGDVIAQFSLFDNRENAEERFAEGSCEIHIRGGTTREYPKKGYKLSIKEILEDGSFTPRDVTLLGLRDDDDWQLSACYNDPERVRNVFSSWLWKEGCAKNNSFHLDNGMRYEYIELFVDGEYQGLYALGYPIDEKQLKLGITVYGEVQESLYKKKEWHYEAKQNLEQVGALPGYEIKGAVPEGDEILAWQPLRDYYKNLFSEELTPQEIYDMVDIQNSIDVYLLVQLIQGVDNFNDGENAYPAMKNMFMTAKKQGDRTVMIYTPWDMDLTWGNGWIQNPERNYIYEYKYSPEHNIRTDSTVVYRLLEMNDPDIKDLIYQRYAQLRQGAWSEERILTILEEYEKDIFYSGAYKRDILCWPSSCKLSGEQNLDVFKDYVLKRLECMDNYILEICS